MGSKFLNAKESLFGIVNANAIAKAVWTEP